MRREPDARGTQVAPWRLPFLAMTGATNRTLALTPDARDVAHLLLHERALTPTQWQLQGRAVRQLRNEQVSHADLNCRNLMLERHGKARIVDFDTCGFRSGEGWKGDNLSRLLRSLRKKQRRNRALRWTEDQWQPLLDGYEAVPAPAA